MIETVNRIQFYNGSPGAPGANRPQNTIAGNRNFTTLAKTVSGSVVAATLIDQLGHPLPYVVLGKDFFNDPTVSQPDTLLHEALHYALSMNDEQLKGYLYGLGFLPKQDYGSGDISQWLEQDCPKEHE